MDWIKSTQITEWAKDPAAKSALPLLLSRLVRATAPSDTFLEFPSGAAAYLGGWDGVVKSNKATSFVPEGMSLWEMGTEKDIKGKADEDYEKRTKNQGEYTPAESSFVFVTTQRWTQKNKWVKEKKAEKVWKDVVVYDVTNLEQWLRDAPAVGWWLAVLSSNMPAEGILSAEQSWNDYAESTRFTLSTQVLTCSRAGEADAVRAFLKNRSGATTVKARSREEAVAFILAAGMELDEQGRQNFLSRVLVIENAQSFRLVANNRYGLILIAKFEDTQPINAAISNGHQVFLAVGADDTHSAGNTLDLPQLGRELEDALIASGLAPENARKNMLEAGRDLTILRRRLQFPYTKIKWAASEYASLLLPALFLGRWDEKRKGDIELMETLAGEPYSTYIAKLNRWRTDPNPFVYQIGSCWRLASPWDAWVLLANQITMDQLSRFEKTALGVLGQVKPLFDLEPDKRFMAPIYGKDSIYSSWARQGVSQSLILFALFGNHLQLPIGDSQQWVDDLIDNLLESDNLDLWRSLNDVMPLVAEAAPERFLSIIYTSLVQAPERIMAMFREDPSPLAPRAYHTGLLWALEALAWIPQYLKRVTAILARLAAADPGGTINNRPINSLRGIFLPWKPMTFADGSERQAVRKEVLAQHPNEGWALLMLILPGDHQHISDSHRMRWRPFGFAGVNTHVTFNELIHDYTMIFDLAIPAAGLDEARLTAVLDASTTKLVRPMDRSRIIDHLAAIAGSVKQEKYAILNCIRNLLHHHRSYPDQQWALPECELAPYEILLKLYEPKTSVDTCKQLFEVSHPQFPEMAALDHADWQAEENLIREKRVAAIRAVYHEHGFAQIVELAGFVVEKAQFGETLAFCLDISEQQLELIKKCGLSVPNDFNAGAAFTWANANLRGFNWVKEVFGVLRLKGVPLTDLARFLKWVALTSELYQFVESQDEEVVENYWMNNKPWISTLPDAEKAGAVEHLLTAGRNADAVHQVQLYPSAFSSELIMRTLRASTQSDRKPRSFEIESLFTELYQRADVDKSSLATLEWTCQPLISIMDRPRFARTLQEELASNPVFFVEVLELLYKEEGQESLPDVDAEHNEKRAILCHLAYTLLNDWRKIPGSSQDGEIDTAALNAWVDTTRKLADERKRLKVADVHIGKVLAYYPSSTAGHLPPDAICSLIDQVNTPRIISGFRCEIFNQHSFSSRSPFEGGDLERRKAARYQKMADDLLLNWPVTASAFEELARTYRLDAVMHDQEAERDSLDN